MGASQGMASVAAHGDVAIAGERRFGVWTLLRNPIVSVPEERGPSAMLRSYLFQNVPNPCNASTSIKFEILHGEWIRLELFNVLGEVVRVLADAPFQPGRHTVRADLTGLPSGVFFYRLETMEASHVRKLLLLR